MRSERWRRQRLKRTALRSASPTMKLVASAHSPSLSHTAAKMHAAQLALAATLTTDIPSTLPRALSIETKVALWTKKICPMPKRAETSTTSARRPVSVSPRHMSASSAVLIRRRTVRMPPKNSEACSGRTGTCFCT